jgi:RNA polymerase sigma factor for flagellar operon FliA
MTREQGEQLFLEHLKTIEDVSRHVAARQNLHHPEIEDFVSDVKIRLIEKDYAVIRTYAGRASFKTFITTVIQRLGLDAQIHRWGKWHSSAEAKRIGPIAVELERLIRRDGRTVAEAFVHCLQIDPSVTMRMLEELADRLPHKDPRPRLVELEVIGDTLSAEKDVPTRNASHTERETTSQTVGEIISTTLAGFSKDDQQLLRLHFGAQMSVAEIARASGVDHKPLYPRLRKLLAQLRRHLESAGVNWSMVKEIVESRGSVLDLGLQESSAPRPSDPDNAPDRDHGGSH